MTEGPWFKEGLRFKCTGCGKCCTGSDGYVFLSPQDFYVLVEHLGTSPEEFLKRYTRMIDGQLCLIDAPQTDHCVFLKDNRCTVYQARPIQCKTFPWWVNQLKNLENWQAAQKNCEGINHPDSSIISETEIAVEYMKYVDNLIEQNSDFDYNQEK